MNGVEHSADHVVTFLRTTDFSWAKETGELGVKKSKAASSSAASSKKQGKPATADNADTSSMSQEELKSLQATIDDIDEYSFTKDAAGKNLIRLYVKVAAARSVLDCVIGSLGVVSKALVTDRQTDR